MLVILQDSDLHFNLLYEDKAAVYPRAVQRLCRNQREVFLIATEGGLSFQQDFQREVTQILKKESSWDCLKQILKKLFEEVRFREKDNQFQWYISQSDHDELDLTPEEGKKVLEGGWDHRYTREISDLVNTPPPM